LAREFAEEWEISLTENSRYFWMPDQVRHDSFGTFCETVNINKRNFFNMSLN